MVDKTEELIKRCSDKGCVIKRHRPKANVSDRRLEKADSIWREFVSRVAGIEFPGIMTAVGSCGGSHEVSNLFLAIGAGLEDLRYAMDVYWGRLPEGYIPIARDCFDNVYCLKIGGEDDGAVALWIHDGPGEESDPERLAPVASSFTNFLDSLTSVPDTAPIEEGEDEDEVTDSWFSPDLKFDPEQRRYGFRRLLMCGGGHPRRAAERIMAEKTAPVPPFPFKIMSFGGSLWIFATDPSDPHGFEAINEGKWREGFGDAIAGIEFFATDIVGRMWGRRGSEIIEFIPDSGNVKCYADNIDEWAERYLSEWHDDDGMQILNTWEQEYDALPYGSRLAPTIPFSWGGVRTVDNLFEQPLLDRLADAAITASKITPFETAFDRDKLEKELALLPRWKVIAFGAAICERLLPGFVAYAHQTHDPGGQILRSILDNVWLLPSKETPKSDLSADYAACMHIAPDPDITESPYGSVAYCAATSIAVLIGGVSRGAADSVADIAHLATVAIHDWLIDNPEPGMDRTFPGFYRMLHEHPLTQQELRRQREDLDFLRNLQLGLPRGRRTMSERWFGKSCSIIDFTPGGELIPITVSRTRKLVIEAIQKLLDRDYETEEEESALMSFVADRVPYPEVSNLIFFSDEENPSAVAIYEKAMAYKPICLPDLSGGKAPRHSKWKTKFSWKMLSFAKNGSDEVVREHDLGRIPLCEMQSVFRTPDDDEMCACYEVTEAQKAYIESVIKEQLDLDRFIYHVNRYAN